MLLTATDLPDAYIIDLERIEDARGYFARAWDGRQFREQELETTVAQCNLSHNKRRGTLRGLHYQAAPHEEAKYVRCTKGALYDVIADIRPDSPTYRKWIGVELSETNQRMLYVPPGFAHGFQTLVDDTTIFYLISQFYTPDAERGIRWDDPAFGIPWPLGSPTEISDKDRGWPNFRG